MEEEGIHFTSFDDVYEQNDQFEMVYEEITKHLLAAARNEDITYAVPGHPLVAERTVQLLLERGKAENIDIVIAGGKALLTLYLRL